MRPAHYTPTMHPASMGLTQPPAADGLSVGPYKSLPGYLHASKAREFLSTVEEYSVLGFTLCF